MPIFITQGRFTREYIKGGLACLMHDGRILGWLM
jgi:hypothetical protein